MKKALFAVIAAAGLLASTVYAETTANLLFTPDSIVTAEADGVAGKQTKGKAPSGKQAIIVQAQAQKDGDVNYRLRIDFAKPIQVRSVTKIHVDWEPLDPQIKADGKREFMFSIFTLNREDNKLRRAGTLNYNKRGEDKKSIYQSKDIQVPFNAVYYVDTECQSWTDTLFPESTKMITAIELYTSLGSTSKGTKASEFKGLAVTNVSFE